MADGGEGTAEIICQALGGRWVSQTVRDPLGRPVVGRYAVVRIRDGHERWAVLEMSRVSGLHLVPADERNLLRANIFGTGQLLADALRRGDVDRVRVGLGGSATNDGGVGLAAALGFGFRDAAGRDLAPIPANLPDLARIVVPPPPWPAVPIVGVCDVDNPLLGPRGATRVYGPQKGLRGEAEAGVLERGLARLADVAAHTFGRDHRDVPGAGAAGGLGFGLLTFGGIASLRPGFPLVATCSGWQPPWPAPTWCSPGRAAWTRKRSRARPPPGSPPWPGA